MKIESNLYYSERNRCDVYYEPNRKKVPVAIVVHGGAFIAGGKTEMIDIATFLCEKTGLVAVAVEYSLSQLDIGLIQGGVVIESLALLVLIFISKSPIAKVCLLTVAIFLIILSCTLMLFFEPGVKSKHPQHVQDIASSIAWVRRECHRFGGDKDSIFLLGHSAGAQLSCLVTLNTRFLEDVSVPLECIRGVISISGPCSFFRMQESSVRWLLNGNVFRYKGDDLTKESLQSLQLDSSDRECRRLVSRWITVVDTWPIFHACSKKANRKTPFLLLTAGMDWSLIKHANDFKKELEKNNFHVQLLHFQNTTHFSIRLGWNERNKKIGNAISTFIQTIAYK